MTDAMAIIWVVTFAALLVASIPYGCWVIYTAFKKRWKRLGLQVGIPAAFLSLLVAATALSEMSAYRSYLEGLFDAPAPLGKPLFKYDSERAFNGDGYSISVYDLPASVRARFEAPDAKLLSEFPKHPSYRNHWQFERWRASPFDAKFDHLLDFALSEYDAGKKAGLSAQFVAIREALSRPGAYYAFFHFGHGENPGDIDLFIVDLAGNRIYLINHNT